MAAAVLLRHLLRGRRHCRSLSTASASAILNPSDPSVVLTSKQKSRAALSLLKSETSPERIVEICRAASLRPSVSHLDRSALSAAVSKLSSPSPSVVHLRDLLDSVALSSAPHAIVLFGQAGLLDDAVRVFKSNPSVRSLNSLLFACVIAKNPSEAARAFHEFPTSYGVVPDVETYNMMIKSFAESGTSRSFFSLLDQMSRSGVKPNITTFCNALEGFYREERFDDVNKVLEIMKKHDCYPGGLSTYNVRIMSLCKLKRPGEAKALFKEMTSHGMRPNWVTYKHLIYGFCKEGQLEEAKKLYKEMKSRGCVPDSRCYFMFIHYLCQGDDFESALEVFNETMARNWAPSFSTMKMLVKGLVSTSKVEEAKEVMEKMKEKFSGNADMWKEVEESLPQ